MARQTFFIDSPSSRVAAQLELVFDYVQRTTSSPDDRAELLKALRAPAPPKPQSRPTSAQLELSLTQHEHEHEPLSAPAPVVAKKERAQETKPRKRIHKLIPAAGTTEKETSAIVSKEEWDAHMEQAQQAIHTTGKRTPIPETPYRPSVAKDKDEKPRVSLSSGVGAVFSLEVWGSLSDIDNMGIDPLPSRMSCKGILSDGGFGCVNPKLPGKAYCAHHHSLYCAKTPEQRNLLDAEARNRTHQMVSYEEIKQARNKVRRAGTNAGKGAEVRKRMLAIGSEIRFSMAVAAE
jgi:hypothetical protein